MYTHSLGGETIDLTIYIQVEMHFHGHVSICGETLLLNYIHTYIYLLYEAKKYKHGTLIHTRNRVVQTKSCLSLFTVRLKVWWYDNTVYNLEAYHLYTQSMKS